MNIISIQAFILIHHAERKNTIYFFKLHLQYSQFAVVTSENSFTTVLNQRNRKLNSNIRTVRYFFFKFGLSSRETLGKQSQSAYYVTNHINLYKLQKISNYFETNSNFYVDL